MHMPLSAVAHKSGSMLHSKCSDMFGCAVFSGLADCRLLDELCHIVHVKSGITIDCQVITRVPGHALYAGAVALKGTPNLPLV